jgi:hypothetical protein
MGSRLAEDDQTFQKVSTVTLDENVGIYPGDFGYGETGTMVYTGPTVFGEDDPGTITAYYQGIPIDTQAGIEGLVNSRWAPLIMPQASLSGAGGFRVTLRWLPEIDAGDVGKIKLFGYGFQYNISQHLTAPPMGLDIMVGLFRQSLDIGDIVGANASSYFVAASKSYGVATIFGGFALESSSFDVEYMHEHDGQEDKVSFEMDGLQERRLTLGGSLNFGGLLSAEMSFGRLTTFTGGVGFAF